MAGDPKRIVAEGYDAIAGRYATWQKGVAGSPRMRFLDRLLALLPRDAAVLELGCGAGVASTRILAERARLTGVDISGEQIRRARERVPSASFVQADMVELELPPASFDAVVAFYVFTHVPRAELPTLLERVHAWLRPRGFLLATFGASESAEGVQIDWLGVPMFFSSFDADENRALLRDAGFELLENEVVTQDELEEGEARFLWVLAQKPG